MKMLLKSSAVFSTLVSAPLLAHDGHGLEGIAHDLAHGVWLLAIATCLVSAAVLCFRHWKNTR